MSLTDNSKKKRLLSNTLFLYLLTFSSQFFNLATVPYLSRVLGPAEYGKIGLALSMMSYIQIVVDFGFLLSATRKVAEKRDDVEYVSKLFFSVLTCKLVLGAVVALVFALIVWNTSLRDDGWFYMTYLISQVCFALLPDFLYRGRENMKVITYRTLAIKALFTVLVYVCVKDEGDLIFVPVITLTGNVVAVISTVYHAFQNRYIRLSKITFADTWEHFCDSAQFFMSRVASTVYQMSNAMILGMLYGNASVTTGLYTSADKLVSLTRSVSSPVADSIYPYMVKNKDFTLARKLLFFMAFPIVIAGVVCFIFAHELCAFIFGAEYYEAGKILRLLIPHMMIIFPTYIVTFPIMVPMGLTKMANFSNVFGLAVELVLLGIFLAAGCLNVYTLCIATSATEIAVFLFRVSCVLNAKRKQRRENPSNA